SNESFNTAEFLQQFNDLQQLFIVSQVEVKDKVNDGVSYQYGDIYIKHAEGEKCKRCWKYVEKLGSVSRFDYLCPRCQKVVKSLL
ncbi:zinc finger domain-containing protein, partial [Staphylococcus epidermidis]|uniref:zinc finger domain-containing protein n=1 Tax=Staphylococcus epidermidis TaxID=1282 RepID=UPI0016433410